MSNNLSNLSPKQLWKNFADLNAVPRGSKKEEAVIQFMVDFGHRLGLPVITDEVGNVIIKKPATSGMGNRKTVVLQSHLDMVHQKNNDTDFDFDTQGIDMYVDGDWVKAKGTTLGADNGIGVATIMTILESDDIPHPPLEALFTIDEETGMTGALGLQGGLLDADIMLNLDTEDDDELTIGCAGGIDVTTRGTFDMVEAEDNMRAFSITIKGLTGGHSGMDIHRGRANANKLMNRLLYEVMKKIPLYLQSIDGGGLRNAIPRESTAVILIHGKDYDILNKRIADIAQTYQTEYHTTDPTLEVLISPSQKEGTIVDPAFTNSLIAGIYACPSGIYRMSPDVDDLVQTSNNLARVLVKDKKYEILCLTRSSVDSEKIDLANAIKCAFFPLNGEVTFSGGYPGWTPNPNAEIVDLMKNLYREMFGDDANVYACHAGLECGILGSNYPDMEMISFGPNIRGAHSPDEKVQISSVMKFWNFLLETLNRIPKK